PVEIEGVERSRQAVAVSDLILVIVDRSQARPALDEIRQLSGYKRLIVSNKTDLPAAWDDPDAVGVSARTGAGLEELRSRIVEDMDVDLLRDSPAVTHIRHIPLVERGHKALGRAVSAEMVCCGAV